MALHGKQVIEFKKNDVKLETKKRGSGSGSTGVDQIWICLK